MAEAQVTTSSINGTITDSKTKETLIGASVVVRHMPTGTVYGAATNAKGNFAIQGLRPGGPYTVEVSYVGYKTVKIQNLSLSLGESETLNVKLTDDNQLSEVLVTGKKSNSLNATRTGAATSFNRSSIERTPTVDRSLFDIAKLSPQASISSSGAVSFGGANNRYNSFQIDGAVSNDVFGLSSSGTNGGQTGATPISIEAIDALQVVIAPFDVRQSGFTGGGINAITKSGTNQLKGSAYAFYKNQDFFGKSAGVENEGKRTKLNSQYEYTVGATLGGAIVKNKLFYFLNAEYTDEQYPSRYLVGDGSRVSEASAQKVANHLKKLTNGYDGGGYGEKSIPRSNYKLLARLDWNINAANRLSVRYSYLDANKFNFANSYNRLRFHNNAYTHVSKTHSLVTELNTRFSNSLSNEFRLGYTRIRDHHELDGTPMPGVEIKDGNSSIFVGPAPQSAANSLDQDIITLTNNLTWSKGNHTFIFGTHNEFFKMKNLFIYNNYGYYTFGSVDDFLSTGTPTEALPQSYSYYYSNVNGNKRWAPTLNAAQLGFYAQDEWKATDNFRLTYGLRMDIPLFFDRPTENKAFNSSTIAQNNGVTNHAMPSSAPLFSPRLGFRWNMDSNKRHLLRGGVGLATGRIPFVWIFNSLSSSGIELIKLDYSNEAKMREAKEQGYKFNIDPNNQFTPANASASTKNEVDLIAKNFKFPQTLRVNLAYETVLPGDVKLVVEALYNKGINNIYYKNLNITSSAGNTLDHGGLKRPLYSAVDKKWGDVIYLDNTDKGYSYNLSAQLSKTFAFGLDASVSYTYGKSIGAIDGTSSIARSNWMYSYSFAGQDTPETSYTTFDTRHRIVANLNYRVEYAKYFATTIGLIYNGQSGNRFSMIYNGDINGDGARGNDLMYVPTDKEIDAMNFISNKAGDKTYTPDEQKAAFKAMIEGSEELRANRGSYIPRNALIAPFLHKIDLHFAQDFFFNVGGRRHTLQLNADIMNFTNFLNPNWGVSYSAGWAQSPLAYGVNKSTQAVEYKFSPYKGKIWSIQDIESRWRAQVGIKYIF